MLKWIAASLLMLPHFAFALDSQFLSQSATITDDPSNELQPAGLGRLRPGQRFALTAQSFGDSKYEIEGFSNFPLNSGGPRLIPGSVSSARSGDYGAFAFNVSTTDVAFNARTSPIVATNIESTLLLETQMTILRVSLNYGRILSGHWLVGAGLIGSQTQVRGRNVLGIGGSATTDSLQVTNTDERSLHAQGQVGLIYDGPDFGWGISLRSGSHVLSHASQTVALQMNETRTPPLTLTETSRPRSSFQSDASIGTRISFGPLTRVFFELRNSEDQKSYIASLDAAGYLVALGQIKSEMDTRNQISLAYRNQSDRRFTWYAGPFYQYNQPQANSLKETTYGVKFGTEIQY